MLKKIFFSLVIVALLAPAAFASQLPKENWFTMNPTVQVTSYKWTWNGHVNGVASGSGTVISADGLVVTNNHVIFDDVEQRPLDAFEICVTFEVSKEPLCNYTAKLVANDKDLDIAILKIDPTDVFGARLPELKYLEAADVGEPQEKQEVQVMGYPASGGDTITISKGQISGFDEFNGYKYFKTDTDFDHGSSGGTVLDKNGHYIGIPTYIRSYAENVGYFLDLREALTWIREHQNDAAKIHELAEQDLVRNLARFSKANQELKYATDVYPSFKMELPEGWRFFEISDDGLSAGQKNVEHGAGLSFRFEYYPFEIDEGYMNRLDQEFIHSRDAYPDFKKEAITFAGQNAVQYSYTAYDQKNTIIYIPYGHTLIGLSYGIELDYKEKQLKDLAPVLESIAFLGTPENDPQLPPAIEYQTPPFRIQTAGNFRLQKPVSGNEANLLVRGVQEKNVEGEFRIEYPFIPQDERQLSAKEKLDEAIKWLSEQDAKLITKKEDVVLDGLKGYLYTYEYEGSLYQQIRKKFILRLSATEDRDLEISYDDLSSEFEKNLPTLSQMLRSFESLDEKNADKGRYEFGSLGERFKDIQYHRFAAAISELADKDIVQGYRDGNFRPEFFARRTDALKMILESKNQLEKDRGLGKEVVFQNDYIEYAKEKGILESGAPFRPYESVTLAEAVQWLVAVYEIPVWQGETLTWYKRYMDKAFELSWIPGGLGGPEEKLTRAELAAIVDTVYNQAK
ncbi:MAG: trypsin-like peptidase domain-containing protein [Candidatus Peregrinibacteria bacterium]